MEEIFHQTEETWQKQWRWGEKKEKAITINML
jgi:hypothetical protein